MSRFMPLPIRFFSIKCFNLTLVFIRYLHKFECRPPSTHLNHYSRHTVCLCVWLSHQQGWRSTHRPSTKGSVLGTWPWRHHLRPCHRPRSSSLHADSTTTQEKRSWHFKWIRKLFRAQFCTKGITGLGANLSLWYFFFSSVSEYGPNAGSTA